MASGLVFFHSMPRAYKYPVFFVLVPSACVTFSMMIVRKSTTFGTNIGSHSHKNGCRKALIRMSHHVISLDHSGNPERTRLNVGTKNPSTGLPRQASRLSQVRKLVEHEMVELVL